MTKTLNTVLRKLTLTIICNYLSFPISHCAVTHNPILWRVVGHVHDFLNGASFQVWIYQVSSRNISLVIRVFGSSLLSRQFCGLFMVLRCY